MVCLQPNTWLESYDRYGSFGTMIWGSLIVSPALWVLSSRNTLSVTHSDTASYCHWLTDSQIGNWKPWTKTGIFWTVFCCKTTYFSYFALQIYVSLYLYVVVLFATYIIFLVSLAWNMYFLVICCTNCYFCAQMVTCWCFFIQI